jgi:hypothetical protein
MLPQDKGVRVRERIQSSYDLILICLLRLREFVHVCVQEGQLTAPTRHGLNQRTPGKVTPHIQGERRTPISR